MNEAKYLVITAEGDIDEHEGLTIPELVRVMAPETARDAARYRMMLSLAAEDEANYTDEDGPRTKAANALANTLEGAHPGTTNAFKLGLMLDQLIVQFPEAP